MDPRGLITKCLSNSGLVLNSNIVAGLLRFHMEQSSTSSLGGLLARLPRNAARGLVRVYRYTLSALIGRECRHLPTCSDYADQAFDRHGLWAGGWMTLARVLRCNPWGTSGLDFVPSDRPAGARWYLPWRYGRWRGINETP